MKRICILILLISGWSLSLSAAHIRGGELFYQYIGPGTSANSSQYTVTLKLYIDCGQNDPGQLDESVVLNIFYKANNSRFGNVITAGRVDERFISYDPNSNPCISNPPRDVCYRLRFYQVRIELPNDPSGYVISFQRCCRIEGIRNMQAPSNDFGATYSCEIPGTASLADAVRNSSPVFNTNDAVAICVGSGFEFDFSATDADGDSLSYQFCDAYIGGGPSRGQNCYNCPVPNPGAPPPYSSIRYSRSYSAAYPLGSKVNINRATGLVTGTAPTEIGQFVVTACVSEYRRGVLINTHRKDIHIKVSDCVPLRALLNPDYSYCDDFNVTFKNLQVNPTGSVYTWDFGDGSAPQSSTVPDGTLHHLYADTGTYTVKLSVELSGQCIDETETKAKVYPGFFPGFIFNGGCLYSPFEFTDTTKSLYGQAAFWKWNFGDETTDADTINRTPTPTYLYHSLGFKTVELIVESNKGCKDTVQNTVEVTERPPMNLPFTDTLICTPDSLELIAIGNGLFEWTPGYNILNTAVSNPVVYPRQSTVYRVTMTEKGCTSTGEINVRVVDFVTLFPMPDTTICLTDTFQIKTFSDGLKYTWTTTPNAFLNNDTAKSPFTSPLINTTYEVVSRIGSCVASDTFNVNTVPYPVVDAGPDKIICYDDTTNIIAYTDGSTFQWIPEADLINGKTLGPLAHPLSTTTFSLFGYDTVGCPKPGVDRMIVTVRPEIKAFAGNDTAIVTGQPLELNGSGAEFFAWSPESGLSLTSVSNPVAEINRNITYVLRAFTSEGCYDLDSINIQVFQTMPDIFVPNAFAPFGRNNELKPKAVGISKLDYFRVYNRWGQMVFQTFEFNRGWDGRISGIVQNSQTYVWMTSGTDYTGKKVTKRGTAVLIR